MSPDDIGGEEALAIAPGMDQVKTYDSPQCEPTKPCRSTLTRVLRVFNRPSFAASTILSVGETIVQTRNQTDRVPLSPTPAAKAMPQMNEYLYVSYVRAPSH
jgi:hypothetical protein